MNDKSLATLLDKLQRAAADLLAVAPLRGDARTRAMANHPGAFFVTKVEPTAASIELVAEDRSVEVFRFSADGPSTFDPEPSS